jgi:hypothetical protein
MKKNFLQLINDYNNEEEYLFLKYKCILEKLNEKDKFFLLEYDDETKQFIDDCYNSLYTLMKAYYIRPFFTYFYSLTGFFLFYINTRF